MTHPHADLIARIDWTDDPNAPAETVAVMADALREAIAALAAPVTLAQAMTCPEVLALVDAAHKAHSVLIVTSVTATTGGGIYPAYLDEQADKLHSALALFFALSSNNERKPNAD